MFHVTVLQILARLALLMSSKEMRITGPRAAKQTYVWLYCHGWKVIDHPPFSPKTELCFCAKTSITYTVLARQAAGTCLHLMESSLSLFSYSVSLSLSLSELRCLIMLWMMCGRALSIIFCGVWYVYQIPVSHHLLKVILSVL